MSETPATTPLPPEPGWSLVDATLGGAFGGVAVGLLEVAWLTVQGGTDLTALPWAWGLYGLAGAPVGFVVGLLLLGVRVLLRDRLTRDLALRLSGRSVDAGFGAALTALGVVVGRYVLNRDVFAEQGVPVAALAALLALLGGLAVLEVAMALLNRPEPEQIRRNRLWGAGGLLGGLGVLLGISLTAAPSDTPDWSAGEPATAPADTPRILVLLVDTLRADHLADPAIPTPTLDRLRAEGITFDDAWSAASWTRPGVATLWTGLLPSAHTASTKGSRLPDGVVTWAEVLRAAGVRTGCIANNVNVTAGFGFDQGCDVFHYAAPDYPFGATEGVFGLALYKLLHRVEERLTGGGPPSRYYQPASVVLDRALAFVDAQGEQPWALSVHLMEPHDPYFPHQVTDGGVVTGRGFSRAAHPDPDPSRADELRALYAGEVAHLDRQLGAFVAALEERGLYDDLAIVLVSDHGEEFQEHGGWWHGQTLYAEQTRVPLVVRLPGGAQGGTVASWQVRNLDVAPTIAELAGVGPDPSWAGASLLADLGSSPAAADAAPDADADAAPGADAASDDGSDGEDPVYDEVVAPEAPAVPPAEACLAGRGHPLDRLVVMEEDFEANRVKAVRRDGFALHRAAPGGSRDLPALALYDVITDPGEHDDLLDGGSAICGTFPEDHARSLGDALAGAVGDAEALGVEGDTAELSDADRARLCALGYLSGPDCP
jgi:arylsulfatase A-like enzyme